MLLWSSKDNDREEAHLLSGERAEMKWEKIDSLKQKGRIESHIHQETWSCDPALDWAAAEELARAEHEGAPNDTLQETFDRCKRDVFYLAGWFARGHRYWSRRGGDTDHEIAAVSGAEPPFR